MSEEEVDMSKIKVEPMIGEFEAGEYMTTIKDEPADEVGDIIQ